MPAIPRGRIIHISESIAARTTAINKTRFGCMATPSYMLYTSTYYYLTIAEEMASDTINTGLDNIDFAGKQEIIRLLVEKVSYISYNGTSVEIQTIISPDVQLHPVHRRGLRG
ncbi:MAG: hypothetical protein ABIB93_02910 [Chloroflexota bacterium]